MSSNYFRYLPKTQYMNKQVVNTTRRAKILDFLYGRNASFLKYTIKDGERAEDIAYYYYNDIGKVWLVYLSNNIIDPYTEWPLSSSDFDEFIKSKYAEQSGAVGYDIIRWTQNTTITDNILYYENKEDNSIRINLDTYNLNASLGLITASDWQPVRVYDYEFELNESRREIYLVNRIYADQAEIELERLMR